MFDGSHPRSQGKAKTEEGDKLSPKAREESGKLPENESFITFIRSPQPFFTPEREFQPVLTTSLGPSQQGN